MIRSPVWHPFTQHGLGEPIPLVTHAKGAHLFTADGQQIIDAILPWGEEVTLNAVEVYVSRIRLKIADAGILIRTSRGFGYMLEIPDTK